MPETSTTDKTVGLDTACEAARRYGVAPSVVAKAIVTEPLPLGGTSFRIPAGGLGSEGGGSVMTETLPDLRSDDVSWLAQQETEIASLLNRAAESFLDIGRRLIGVKKRTKGGFIAWVKARFPLSLATAERYMQAAEYVQQTPHAAELSLTVLCLISSPKTPREAAEEIVAAGKTLSLPEAKEIVERHSETDEDPADSDTDADPIANDDVEVIHDDAPPRAMRPERREPDHEPVRVAERKAAQSAPAIPDKVRCEHCKGRGYVMEGEA